MMERTEIHRPRIRRWTWRLGVLGLVALIGAGTAWAAYALLHHWPARKFGVVIPGVLYRSGQPEERGWRYLKDHYGIRTVIDLREDMPNEPWAVLETNFCAANGIRYVKLPVGHDGLTDEQLAVLVKTVSDPRCQPVLVHCKLGRSRTGITIAAYRVVAQGWSYEAALAESQRYKGTMNSPYRAYLKGLAEGRGWRPAVTGALGRTVPPQYAGEGLPDAR
jgi:protein tyrosine/serine phosphatase